MKLTILQGNIFDKIKEIQDDSIDLCITSPPYWGLRNYGIEGQLGLEPTMEAYLDNTMNWVKEVYRVLKPTGSFVLNIGDTFVSSGGKHKKERIFGGIENQEQLRGKLPSEGFYKNKQLLAVSHFAYCRIIMETDFVCRGVHIWAKSNVPSPIRCRLKHSHEYLYWFVKDADKYYFDEKPWMKKIAQISLNRDKYASKKTAFAEQLNLSKTSALQNREAGYYDGQEDTIEHSWRIVGENNKPIIYEYERRIYTSDQIEIATYLREWKEKSGLTYDEIYKKTGERTKFEHYFRTDECGCALPSVSDWWKLKSILVFDDKYDKIMTETEIIKSTTSREELKHAKNIGNTFIDNSGETIEHSWRIVPVGEKQKGFEMENGKPPSEHVAPFPTKLIEPYIKSLCPLDGTVLDTFLGSGTTMRVAMENGRNVMGIELNEKYIEYAKKRLNWKHGLGVEYVG